MALYNNNNNNNNSSSPKMSISRNLLFSFRDFHCPQCEYKSSTQADIKKHIKLRHQKVREFLCEECGYRGSVRGDVVKHKNAVHKGIKPFQCGFCQYRASYKHSLKQHIFNRHKDAKVLSQVYFYQGRRHESALKAYYETIRVGLNPPVKHLTHTRA